MYNPEYRAWCNMIQRCTNESYPRYDRYGGRGITVCEEWLASYNAFFRDVGPRPSKLHSLDRVKNDLGYFPGNVRWATKSEQMVNRHRWTKVYKPTGKCKIDWAKARIEWETGSESQHAFARRLGVSQARVSQRIKDEGWRSNLTAPLL